MVVQIDLLFSIITLDIDTYFRPEYACNMFLWTLSNKQINILRILRKTINITFYFQMTPVLTKQVPYKHILGRMQEYS